MHAHILSVSLKERALIVTRRISFRRALGTYAATLQWLNPSTVIGYLNREHTGKRVSMSRMTGSRVQCNIRMHCYGIGAALERTCNDLFWKAPLLTPGFAGMRYVN